MQPEQRRQAFGADTIQQDRENRKSLSISLGSEMPD
jgi:hypothetical protein